MSLPSTDPDTARLPSVGTVVTVRVPATSANLGPGFDALGLALALHDEVTLTLLGAEAATDPANPRVEASVDIDGEGSGEVPRDASHLVVRAAVAALRHAGVAADLRLHLSATNAIPHGRGLGSSAAATVAGVLAGLALAHADTLQPGPAHDAPPALVDAALALATAFEGHPDNAAPALLGGATVAWMRPTAAGTTHPGPNAAAVAPAAARLRVLDGLAAVVAVPQHSLATSHARGLLPALVPHGDAAFAAGRAALLVHALGSAPELLFDATADTLHQEARRGAMPQSLALVDALRSEGYAAVVSGAGPTVLVLTTAEEAEAVADAVRLAAGAVTGADGAALADEARGAADGFEVKVVPVDRGGAQLVRTHRRDHP